MFFQIRRSQERAARHIAPMITCAFVLAAVVGFASPSAAQVCGFGEGSPIVCGTVWSDLNGDGIQQIGEPGIGGVTVTVFDSTNNPVTDFFTNPDGTFFFGSNTLTPGTYTISIDIKSGTQASPTDNPNTTDNLDSDGIDSGMNTSYFTLVIDDCCTQHDIDFGFKPSTAKNPGTGTPGYWKNHPGAWPVSSITLGGVLYSRDDAIALMAKPGKDKRATLFASLLSATLNVGIGNDASCIQSTIDAANDWLETWGVPNTNPIVAGGSAAWAAGEPLHKLMDAYNNGLSCAPHRN